jgi:hypothetical protein
LWHVDVIRIEIIARIGEAEEPECVRTEGVDYMGWCLVEECWGGAESESRGKGLVGLWWWSNRERDGGFEGGVLDSDFLWGGLPGGFVEGWPD